MKQFYLGLFRLCFKCQLVASVGYRLIFFCFSGFCSFPLQSKWSLSIVGGDRIEICFTVISHVPSPNKAHQFHSLKSALRQHQEFEASSKKPSYTMAVFSPTSLFHIYSHNVYTHLYIFFKNMHTNTLFFSWVLFLYRAFWELYTKSSLSQVNCFNNACRIYMLEQVYCFL